MRTAAVVLAILVGAAGIMAAIAGKPTGFDRCVAIVGADIDARASATGATLDPRDVEIEAAKVCAGTPSAD